MNFTYVPSWLTLGDRDIEGWPKFVTPEQRTWLTTKVSEFLAQRGTASIADIVYWLFRLPDSPRWALLDAQYAATHRALLAAEYAEVWATKTADSFTVAIGDDDIAIRYRGEEVLYWTMDEWVEDPKLVLNIVNVVRMASNEPAKLHMELVKLGKLA